MNTENFGYEGVCLKGFCLKGKGATDPIEPPGSALAALLLFARCVVTPCQRNP